MSDHAKPPHAPMSKYSRAADTRRRSANNEISSCAIWDAAEECAGSRQLRGEIAGFELGADAERRTVVGCHFECASLIGVRGDYHACTGAEHIARGSSSQIGRVI